MAEHGTGAAHSPQPPALQSMGAALISYVFSIVGAGAVLLFRKEDDFARFHAKQSLIIFALAAALFVSWAVVGVVLSQLPYWGFILTAVLFALVLGLELLLGVSWLSGILFSLLYKRRMVAIAGGVIELVQERLSAIGERRK